MKRTILLILVFLFVFSIIEYSCAMEELNGFHFQVEKDESISIMGYDGIGGEVNIPNQIDGKPVKIIARGAFANNVSIISVVVPEGIIGIESDAFNGCESMSKITLPTTLESIGEDAFMMCNSLKSIHIPEKITKLADSTFSICEKLQEIVLPKYIKSLGNNAISVCGIRTIDLPYGLEYIGTYGLSSNFNLETLVLPNSVKEIGEGAFGDNSSLSSVILSTQITKIKDYTFSACPSLTKLVVPKSVKKFEGSEIFSNSFKVNIWGFTGSEAEMYAKNNDIPFFVIDPINTVNIIFNNEVVNKSRLNIDLNEKHPSIRLFSQTAPESPWPGVTWKSSSPKSVSVDAYGLVTGLKKGKATVTATADDGSGKKATCEILVAYFAKAITLTGENTLKAGKKLKLTASISPENTSDKRIEWSSSDKAIATVDSKGTVTAKKTNVEKTVIITAAAKDGGEAFAEIKITIIP